MVNPKNTERSFIMVKPDAVQRGLVGKIIARFESRGYKLVAIKTMKATPEILRQHYSDLVDKPFFPAITEFMTSGPVVPMVWEGKDVVKNGRTMLGATDPSKSAPGTIRGDFGLDVGRNVCHGSDSVESAEHEIKLWFKEEELVNHPAFIYDLVYEN
ncbi:nucleoside diphosphate kinase [Starmerella bacillaris]|uniref:Nucleoside diphosphate kinase n=1 Tax=Starmerella bacillaris TaxID=1247836 RepID=A0AAV5RMT7_STABA|nr:nucleoside diphosphate kinase [Starmerella bacillaris]